MQPFKALKMAHHSSAQASNFFCCVQVVDIGTQENNDANLVVQKRKIVFIWECIDDLLVCDGSPQKVYKSYEMSLNEGSVLLQDLKDWIGHEHVQDRIKRFIPKSMLGKYCQLHWKSITGSEHAQKFVVQNISPVPSDFDHTILAKPMTKLGVFMASEPDMELFATLPPEIQEKIKLSPEFTWARTSPDTVEDHEE